MRHSASMFELVKKNKNLIILIGIYFLGIVLFSVLIHTVVRLVGSDDIAFQKQISPYATIFDWVNYRYHSWSGRIFAESFVYIFSPLPIHFWKIVEVILYALFSGFTFLYYLLFTEKRTAFKDRTMLILAIALPTLMDTGVILTGQLWVTGSMNYFWLATFTLMALYPVLHYTIRNKKPRAWITIVGLISIIVAASSQEQGGLVLTGLMVLFTGYAIFTNFIRPQAKKFIPFYPILFTLVAITCLFIGLIAPGNTARIGSETITWRPDFFTIPLIDHAEYASRWLIDSIINHSGFLLITGWVLLITLFLKKQKKKALDYTYVAILSAASIISTAKGFDSVNPLLVFYASWNPEIPHRALSLATLTPWVIAILATITAPVALYGIKRKKGIMISILLAAFFCSILIITLSPTMYASGPRTLFFPAVILMFVAYILFDEFINKHKKDTVIIVVFLLVCLAVAQYYKLLTQLLSVN